MSEARTVAPEALLRVTRAVYGGHDAAALLRRFSEAARDVVSFNGVVMGVLTPSRDSIRLLAASIDREIDIPSGPFPIEGTSVGHVLLTGQPYLSGDLMEAPLRFPDEELHRSLGVRCTALLPM